MKPVRMQPRCLRCLLDNYLEAVPENTPQEKRLAYMQRVLALLAQSPVDAGAPVLVGAINDLRREMFGYTKDYTEIKRYFNALMLGQEAAMAARIDHAAEPLRMAIQYAMIGNYIDFGAMERVDETYLESLLARPEAFTVDDEAYAAFCKEIAAAKRVVFITDNCGEIVMDKLLIRAIRQSNPQAKVTAVVRGAPVLNDATLEDAQQVGLDEYVRVMGNGTHVAGTHFPLISCEAKEAIDGADVIIAKGQANYETMQGCGLNIFYIFMCKCTLFAERFSVPQFTGVLVHDSRCAGETARI